MVISIFYKEPQEAIRHSLLCGHFQKGMVSHLLVNSKEYWDHRFSTNWEEGGGRNQSSYFYNVILQFLPENIKREILNEKLSICDVGCAEGDGVYIFSRYFVNSNVVGSDFSDKAIDKANTHYPENKFICENMLDIQENYDVLVSSNVLEHFPEPFNIIDNIIDKARRYFIVLVPFKEYYRHPEHFYTFDENSFPQEIKNFKLTYTIGLNCTDRWFQGFQILCVYKKGTNTF